MKEFMTGVHGYNMDELLKDAPSDKWICEECGSENTNWTINVSWMLKKTGDKYRKGYCPSCKEAEEKKEAERLEAKKKYEEKQRTETLYRRAEIPENIKTARFDKLVVRDGAENAFDKVKRVLSNRCWLYLYGDNSVGKSFLVGAAINMLIEKSVPTLYVNESQLFDRIRFSWDKNSKEKESDIFNLFKAARVVFWDEFLFFNFIDRECPLWKYERMYSLIEYCSENGKIMVFTSNIDPSDKNDVEYHNVMERAGKRIVARLKRHDTLRIKMSNKPFC